jgi:voltage-gated potassium channel
MIARAIAGIFPWVGPARPPSNHVRVDERSARISGAFELPMLVAALLVIPAIVIDESHLREPWPTIGSALNWVIWVAFAAELIVMLAVVPSRRVWLAHHPLEVIIVLVTPPFLPASLQAARALRLIRLIRLARLARLSRQVFSLAGLRYAAILALLTVLGGGAAFAAVEKRSTWDGVWWAVTGMTTLGSEIQPRTTGGRVIAIVTVLVGIGFVALATGAVAQRFLRADVAAVADEVEEVGEAEEDLLAEVRVIAARLRRLEQALARGGAQPRG